MFSSSKGTRVPQFFVILLMLAISIASVVFWQWLKIQAMREWSDVSIVFMPGVIALALALIVRFLSPDPSFFTASLVFVLSTAASAAGWTLQHRLEVSARLHQAATAAYDETMKYAKTIAPINSMDDLQSAMLTDQTSAIGRIALAEGSCISDFWSRRNIIHFCWIMSRQIHHLGVGGKDKTLLEASTILKEGLYLDRQVNWARTVPISQDEVEELGQKEIPYFKKMISGEITRESYVAELKQLIESRITWSHLAFRGFGPFLALSLMLGLTLAHRILYGPEDNTESI